MNKTQYINAILKRIPVTDRTKNRIRADLTTEIEALRQRAFLGGNNQSKGSPEALAKSSTPTIPTRKCGGNTICKRVKDCWRYLFSPWLSFYSWQGRFRKASLWYSPEAAGKPGGHRWR